jgi:hypothetical protein
MIVIFGFRRIRKQLGAVIAQCGHCGMPAGHTILCVRRSFALFYIPLIPLSSSYFTVCSHRHCSAQTPIDKEKAIQLVRDSQVQRDSPTPQVSPYALLAPIFSPQTALPVPMPVDGKMPPMPPIGPRAL